MKRASQSYIPLARLPLGWQTAKVIPWVDRIPKSHHSGCQPKSSNTATRARTSSLTIWACFFPSMIYC